MINKLEFPGIKNLIAVSDVNEIKEKILTLCPVTRRNIEDEGIYIFGVGKLGQLIFDFLNQIKIKIHGFADNNEIKQKFLFNSLNVISADEIPTGSIVYIASATYFHNIKEQLSDLGLTKLISHNQASVLFDGEISFPIEMYQKDLFFDLIESKQKYLDVFELLEDNESKNVFDSLVQYRLTLNHSFINDIHTKISKEYFDDDVIKLSDNETYFDIGGFDGDSAENFIKHVNQKFSSIHIFEPDAELLKKAIKRLKNDTSIFFNELGVFNKKTTLYFDITGGLDGNIAKTGSLKIETTTLDDYQNEPTFIKFDVEGVEIEAIEGAINTLKNIKPKMAVASYHLPKHLWEIPSLVKEINPTYKLKLRHYTNSVFDTIYYFM
jgi:FkbM family methyltransferase